MEKLAKVTHIKKVGTVFIPVSDQDKALDFYINKLGFEKCVDASYSDGKRWIEVAPPKSEINIALVSNEEGNPSVDDQTYCAFSTNHIEADFETLKNRDVGTDRTKRDEQIGIDLNRSYYQRSCASTVFFP